MAEYVGDTKLEGADIGVLVAYFVIVIGFGLWSSLKNRGSVGGYFLAGRSMNWILVGASLFASNIGSGHFIGLAGSGAATGIGISVFELNAIYVLMILGWVFVPVYIASGVFTMPEYLRLRFGGQRIRVYLAVMALILSVFTKVAADLYAGAIFIELALGWNLYAAIVLLLAIAALFTIAGGLTAVIWTDFIQTIIMLIGALYLMIVSFRKVKGWDALVQEWPNSVASVRNNATTCGLPPDNAFKLFRDIEDPLPWPGVIFGLAVSAVWYWCTDQVIVQRTLASKDLSHAKGGCLLAGYLKFLPMWIIVVPGMIARILFPDTVGCADPEICMNVCGTETGCTNIAYPTLVLELMPVGARGLMLAVMIAALMSSLTSVFNSSSTIFTIDIWKLIRKEASDMELMIVGRVFVLVMVAIGIAWIPIVQNFAELFVYIQSVTSFLAPPICAIYVLAVLWERVNELAAFWSLMAGLGIGMIRFIWESVYGQTPCGEESQKPDIIAKVHYLHFGIILFVIVAGMCIVISLLTEPIDHKHLVRLTFWTRYSQEERIDIWSEEEDGETGKKGGHGDGTYDNPAFTGPSSSQQNLETEAEELPCYKSAWSWVCGIEKHPELLLTPEEEAAIQKKQISLDENPGWKRICAFNAVVLLTLTTFYWGFFA